MPPLSNTRDSVRVRQGKFVSTREGRRQEGRGGGGEDVCFYLVAHCSGRHWGRWGQAGVRPCLAPWGRACKESLADQSEAPGPEPASCHKACSVRAYLQYTGIRTKGRQPLLKQDLNASKH